VRAREPSEVQLQISLAQRLCWQCRPGVIWFHCPNGELRDKVAAAKLKAMGVRAGVADLIFIWAATRDLPLSLRRRKLRVGDGIVLREQFIKVLFLELKSRTGRQSPEQRQFQTDCGAIGCHYALADNIDQAVELLQQHEILPRPRNKGGDNNEYRGAER
jgi:hypothetical protein